MAQVMRPESANAVHQMLQFEPGLNLGQVKNGPHERDLLAGRQKSMVAETA